MAEKIKLTAKDGKSISSLYYEVPEAKCWAVYLHMMPETKESWNDIAEYLQKSGCAGLSIDLRGHGESDGGPDGYHKFSDEEHQASMLDLEAAISFLIERGASREKIAFVGASIGANLSLVYLGRHHEYKAGILLSPGLNYRGIETVSAVKNLMDGQRVFFISSRDDGNNADQCQLLYDVITSGINKKIEIYETGGHGTSILKNHPDLSEMIKNFLSQW